MRISLALCLAFLTTSCCCPRGTQVVGARSPERHFVLLRTTPLKGQGDEASDQILIECCVVAIRADSTIPAVDEAERLETGGTPTWLSGNQMPEATFGARATVLMMPSIVTANDEEATIQVCDEEGTSSSCMTLRMKPTLTAQGVSVVLSYERDSAGRALSAIPSLTLRGPTERVFIVEALKVP